MDVRNVDNAGSNYLSGSRHDDFQGRNVYREETGAMISRERIEVTAVIEKRVSGLR